MAKPLNNNTNPILLKEPDGIAFKLLKESLMTPHALGDPNYQTLVFPLYMKMKVMPCSTPPKMQGLPSTHRVS